MAKALRAYANHINDLELKKDVHFSKSKLKAVSATMLKGIAANVLAKASAPGIDLTDYGVDATVLADFAAAKADFILKCNTPREAIAIRKTNTRKLNLLKKQMMDLLKDEVDLLVDVLPDLYDDFKETFSNTRIIIDRKGKRLKRKPEEGYGVIYGNVYNAAGEPVEDAIVTVKESGKELTTDEEGAFYDEKEKVGIYTLEVVALTYKKKIVPNVEVVANDEMTIDIVLELDEIV